MVKKAINIVLLFIISGLICSCQPKQIAKETIQQEANTISEISESPTIHKPDTVTPVIETINKYSENLDNILTSIGCECIDDFFDWIIEEKGIDALYNLALYASEGEITSEILHKITGYGIHAFTDIYNSRLDKESENYEQNIINLGFTEDNIAEFGFVGDVSFADNWRIMPKYDRAEKGVLGILDREIVDIMKSVDIMSANNEFCLSERGEPIPNKAYTFRGHPSRAAIWHEMGVDLVTLANNHVYDYGKEAFIDTLDTLDNQGIVRVGGGRNIEEASRPIYYIINGYKVAICAATRAEKDIFTPEATEAEPGVMYTYNSEAFCKKIAEAKSESDFVIVYVHWGYEQTTKLETVQIRMGKEFIDSGADMIIGHHAHSLQKIDVYKGKMIFYNLGNFIFSGTTVATGIVKAIVNETGELEADFIPCYQQGCHTRISKGDEYNQVLDLMRSLSPNLDISESGKVTLKTNKKDETMDSLKILAVGNSFSMDGMEYLYQILEDLKIEKVVLGNLYIPGCSLQTHSSNAENNIAAYTYYKNTTGVWEENPKISLIDTITEEEWDIITFQQASGFSGKPESYEPFLTNLTHYVNQYATNPKVRLAWHLTWAYQKDSDHAAFPDYNNDQIKMYNDIIDAYKTQIKPKKEFSFVIPSGIAIQNARNTKIGDTLTRDGYHLSIPEGRYIAGLTWAQSLTGMDISNVSYMPEDIDTALKDIIIDSVIKAKQKP